MFRNIDQNKKLFFIAIISLFIPATYFTASRTDINFYVVQQLFYTILFVLGLKKRTSIDKALSLLR